MHVLHIVGTLNLGGAEKLVFDLARVQATSGHRVSVALLSSQTGCEVESSIAAKRQKLLWSLGVTVNRISGSARAISQAAWNLRRAYGAEHVDIVHAHLAAGIISSQVLPHVNSRIWTLHSTEFAFPSGLVRLSVPFVDAFVGCSSGVSKVYEPQLRSRLVTINNGIDLTHLAGSQSIRSLSNSQCIRVLAVGALRPEKNYPRLVAACSLANSQLQQLGRRLELRIVGEGDQRTAIEGAIRSSDAGHFITLLGARDNIPDLMRGADLFVMSSDREGLPIALIEALSSGLPYCVTPFVGIRRMFGEMHAGLVADNFDASSLASSIVRISTQPGLAEDFSRDAVKIAEDFDIRECAKQYEQLYTETTR